MAEYYHITNSKNLSNILTEGLIPNKGYGMSRRLIKHNKNFITDNIAYIIHKQIGFKRFITKDYVVLNIEPYGLNIKEHTYWDHINHKHEVAKHEFVCFDVILPNKISVMQNN